MFIYLVDIFVAPVWTKTSSRMDIFVSPRSGHIFLMSNLPAKTANATRSGHIEDFPAQPTLFASRAP